MAAHFVQKVYCLFRVFPSTIFRPTRVAAVTIDDVTMKAIFAALFAMSVTAASWLFGKLWSAIEKKLDDGDRFRMLQATVDELAIEIKAIRADMRRRI